jgi:hypothetical protein
MGHTSGGTAMRSTLRRAGLSIRRMAVDHFAGVMTEGVISTLV